MREKVEIAIIGGSGLYALLKDPKYTIVKPPLVLLQG